jgi:hypothetical protein
MLSPPEAGVTRFLEVMLGGNGDRHNRLDVSDKMRSRTLTPQTAAI